MTPDGWTPTRIGAIARESMARVIPAGQDDVLYVGLEHIAPCQTRLSRWGRAAEVTSAKTEFRAGDTLFGKLRPYLRKVALAHFSGVCSTDILAVRPTAKTIGSFLHALLSWERSIAHAVETSAGTKMPRTSWKAVAEFEVALPPLPEQKKIAAILSSVDDAIESTQAVIEQLGVVKQAMMAELLTRGLPGRHTRFLQTELGELPEEWEVLRFGDLLPEGTANGLYKEASFYGRGSPMLDMGDLFRSDILERRERRRVEVTEKERKRFLLREGDLLFARRSLKLEGAGQCALVPALSEYPVFESSIIRARLDLNRCHPAFFLNFWNGPVGFKLRMRIARQVAVSGISAGDLVQLPVPLPTVGEQVSVSTMVGAVCDRIAVETQTVLFYGQLKSALMSVLLTGEVRVQPDEEAA